jgi:hypothetical protein
MPLFFRLLRLEALLLAGLLLGSGRAARAQDSTLTRLARYLGGGYLLTKGKPFLLFGPGIGVTL